ncbi:MAG TPA: TonB-dependent receptor [Pricia sp.]|nr:TonB-dependent receptor [Pricia sp.]
MLAFFIWSASFANETDPLTRTDDNILVLNDNLQNVVQTNVSGVVTDENGTPLPGASVVEMGTGNGTTTDFDGNYSITVANENSILVFSYIGYSSKEMEVGTSTTVNVQLEPDASELDEVVVLGYGTKKRSEVTNAVVQTTGEIIEKSPSVSLSNSLSGRLAGLYVNQRSSVPGFDDAQILVRGFNTTRNNSALIVIDGVANADPDGLNRLDPNDIESITVLKDASAAIYGAQSAGGVILVTTKRGKTGKPVIDFSTTQSYQFPTKKPETANALEYIGVLNSSRALDGTDPDYPQALVNQYRNGQLVSEDWWDALVDAPVEQSRQSVTVRGGSERVRYFTSLGTASQDGLLRGDNQTKLRQYNVRSNLDVDISDSFEVGLDLSYRQKYTQTPQNGGGGGLGSVATTSPLRPAYIDGNYSYPGEGWSQSNPAARILSPGYRKYTSDVLNGTVRFTYKIPDVKGLSLEGFASVIKTFNFDKTFNYTWFYFEKNSEGEIVKKPSRTIEDIGLTERNARSNRFTLNTKLGYVTTIAEKHTIDVFVAYEQSEYKGNFSEVGRLGFDSPQIDQIFAGSTDRSNWITDGSANENARQNYFGRMAYDFDKKYLLGFNFRYDGSPIFPEETRWGFFPGVSAGWVLSKESFMPEIFSNLKIRASWGQLGNDRVDPFQYIGAFNYSDGAGSWVVDGQDVRGIEASTTPNPNITWEVTETTDIGLEVGFLDNRLALEVDVFKSKTSDILGTRQASIPNYTGLELPDENIGEMENKGIEFQLTYKNTFGKLFFSASGNASYNKNKIIFFDEVPQAEEYQKLEGMPFGSILAYDAIGIYRTQADLDNNVNYDNAGLGGLIFADLNDDNIIDGNDRYRYNASAFPTTQFGLNLAFDFKGFDLNVLLQGQAGAKWRLDNGFDTAANGNGLAYVANKSYSLANPDAPLPRIRPVGLAASDSDFWYHDVAFVRFKSFELGYSLPQDVLNRSGISNLRLYISGQNLFLLYNSLDKFGTGDPEFLDNGLSPNDSDYARASGKGATYPNMSNMGLGLNISF